METYVVVSRLLTSGGEKEDKTLYNTGVSIPSLPFTHPCAPSFGGGGRS